MKEAWWDLWNRSIICINCTEVQFYRPPWIHNSIFYLICCLYFITVPRFVLWPSLKRQAVRGMGSWSDSPHRRPGMWMARLSIDSPSLALPPNDPMDVPFSSSGLLKFNILLPTWLYGYSSCSNLCGLFDDREVYVLIIAYAELHKLGRQRIKYKTDIPKQGKLPTVEITMVIKEEFCNYKDGFTMKRK